MTKTVAVILDRPHTHQGAAHAIGAQLSLAEHDAVWLIRQGVAHLAKPVRGLHINTPAAADAAPSAEPDPPTAPLTPDTDPSTGDHHE